MLLSGAALVVGPRSLELARQSAAAPGAKGKPGDFNFLAGAWTIRHRRPKADKTWDDFEGEATCWTILGGTGSIEELRIPARDFSGLGVRLLDSKTQLWNDYWVNGKDRAMGGEPGLTGAFVNGVGTFTTSETDDGRPITVRGVWDRITPTSHRWRQGVSRDGGTTWDENWFMDWTRA